jgi:hypothetical protein
LNLFDMFWKAMNAVSLTIASAKCAASADHGAPRRLLSVMASAYRAPLFGFAERAAFGGPAAPRAWLEHAAPQAHRGVQAAKSAIVDLRYANLNQ